MPFADVPICFKEDAFCETLVIPNHKPGLNRLLEIIVLPEVIDYSPISTPQGFSFEGEKLTGLKIISHVNFEIKIAYKSTLNEQTIHSVHYHHLKTLSFNIPESICTSEWLPLIESNQLAISPQITSIYTKPIDTWSIYAYIKWLVQVFIY